MSSYYGAAWEAYGVEHWEMEDSSWMSSEGKSGLSERQPWSSTSDRVPHGRAGEGEAENFDLTSQDASSDASWWQGDSWQWDSWDGSSNGSWANFSDLSRGNEVRCAI